MTMIHNGVEVKSVIYNGTDLDKVINNGVTVFEKAPSADPVFANNTPEQIQAAVRAGIASTLWRVGDKIPIKLQGTVGNISLNGTYYAYIIGFDHNKDLESNGEHNLHLQFAKLSDNKNIAFYVLAMNSSNTNTGGWKNSVMRNTNCSAFLNAMPTVWKNVITDCTKYTDNTGGGSSNNSSAVTTTQDKIWLPAEYEIFGARTYANQYEKDKQARYQYYSVNDSKADRVRYRHNSTSNTLTWWLRSLGVGYSSQFGIVYTSGDVNRGNANSTRGFAPCFQIS